MAQQIQIRRDTSTNWSSVNPSLAQGELGLETNTGKVKIGDGTTAWNSLSYFGGAGALASLTDVSITSLASGQVVVSNGSATFINQSLSSLIGELAFASLGSLAFMNQLSFTSLTNQPSLSSLAFQSTLDYTSGQLLNKPSLGSLAEMNALSFTSLLNQPSLGSLAFVNSLTASDVGLGNVTNDAQLKIASNLSDLNNVVSARGNLSLGSLAVLDTVSATLPSTASVDILYSNGIVNYSTISTNLLYANNLYVSTISTGIITSNAGVFASNVSLNTLQGRGAVFVSTVSARSLRGVSASWSGSISAANLSGDNNGDEYNAIFGTGADGAVDFDGSSTTYYYPFSTYNASTLTYTLTRDVYATTFAVRFDYTLETSGYRIFATDSILNEGVIQNNGGNASGTTAGAGAAGGFFKAGGTGATGIAAGAAGADGPAPVLPTANTLLGNFGARGAAARLSLSIRVGNNAVLASAAAPLPAIGGAGLEGNIMSYMSPFIPSGTAANTQLQWSMGGGAGAKSAVGTAASSGGGGGGGGVIFLCSYAVTNNGNIYAKGGNGGNAAGTGGTFGGGGGGGGGVVAFTTSRAYTVDTSLVDVSGGTGGTSAGTANTIPLARVDSTNTFVSNVTVQYFSIQPVRPIEIGSYYILSIHTLYDAGTAGGVNSITGLNTTWVQRNGINFGTIATPTRSLYVFTGKYEITNTDPLDVLGNNQLKINLPAPVSQVRVILDEIQNSSMSEGNDPYVRDTTTTSDSTANIATDFGSLPTVNNLIYTVVARASGTTPVAGTANLLINNQTTGPLLVSQVAISRASNNQTWTTATAAGAISIDLGQPTTTENGLTGQPGKILRFYA